MKRRHILPLSAALIASAAVSVPAAVPASGTTATLFALEIFAPEPGAVAGPRCATRAGDEQDAPAATLPEGTVPVAVLQGSLPNGVRGCRVLVGVGGGERIAVYKGADTQIRKRELLRSGVRVIAARDEQTGVLVAEKIVGRQVARNEVERAFTATVDVVSTGDVWVTTDSAGAEFSFDVTTVPADIELGLGEGDQVTVEFAEEAPPAD